MGLVQCFSVVLMLSAQLVLTVPLEGDSEYYIEDGKRCKMCPAGEFQKSCTECEPCGAGTYTTQKNREESCHYCFEDCKPEKNLKVVQNCTSTSDVKCSCKTGFVCVEKVAMSPHCRSCVKIPEVTATAATISSKHTPSSASSGHSSDPHKSCQFPECDLQLVSQAQPASTVITDHPLSPAPSSGQNQTSHVLVAILCPVVVMGCVVLVILLLARRPGDESRFKKAVALLVCSKGGRDASHKPKESTHQFPRESFCARHQSSSLSTANLGPVNVYNPGTVIFSFLSHFTGQVGSSNESVKTPERGCSVEEDVQNCPVVHPTSSPSVHLSEEERSGDVDSIFYPSQEQGKDCHVSKEEML